MIKIAIVDDEQTEINILRHYYEDMAGDLKEELDIHEFLSGEELLKGYDCSYDLVCLDIDMDGKDGISIAKEIRCLDEQVLIIFVTNMAQMAIKGYEVRALDFLLKPVEYYPFVMKIRNAINIINNKKSRNIVINTTKGLQKISTNELYYAEVNGHYLYYHTADGIYSQKTTLKELEDKLTGLSFKRCNNCYLVNLKYVDCVNKDELKINGEWLKISRPRKKEFLQSLANYMGGLSL